MIHIANAYSVLKKKFGVGFRERTIEVSPVCEKTSNVLIFKVNYVPATLYPPAYIYYLDK